MNPCIGDRQLEPDDEPEVCERCDGDGTVWHRMNSVFVDCPSCQRDTDPGEPNEDPE